MGKEGENREYLGSFELNTWTVIDLLSFTIIIVYV